MKKFITKIINLFNPKKECIKKPRYNKVLNWDNIKNGEKIRILYRRELKNRYFEGVFRRINDDSFELNDLVLFDYRVIAVVENQPK